MSNSLQSEPSPQGVNSSPILRTLRIMGVGAAAVLAFWKIEDAKTFAESERAFGTLESPKFRALATSTADAPRSIRELALERSAGAGLARVLDEADRALAASTAALKRAREYFEACQMPEQVVRDLREALCSTDVTKQAAAKAEWESKRPKDFNEERVQLVMAGLTTCIMANRVRTEGVGYLNTFVSEQHVKDIEFATVLKTQNLEELAQKYGDVEGYSRVLFERVTGAPVPSHIKVSFEDIAAEDSLGYALQFQGTIGVEKQHFAYTTAILCHEFGHHAALPLEDAVRRQGLSRMLLEDSGIGRNIRVIEEASAYAFQYCCILQMEHPEIREIAIRAYERDVFTAAEQFAYGEQEIHREALVVADAAIQVFGDPSQAYNYLSTTRELSPAIQQVVGEVKELCLVQSNVAQLERILKSSSALSALVEDFQAFLLRHDPEWVQK